MGASFCSQKRRGDLFGLVSDQGRTKQIEREAARTAGVRERRFLGVNASERLVNPGYIY